MFVVGWSGAKHAKRYFAEKFTYKKNRKEIF